MRPPRVDASMFRELRRDVVSCVVLPTVVAMAVQHTQAWALGYCYNPTSTLFEEMFLLVLAALGASMAAFGRFRLLPAGGAVSFVFMTSALVAGYTSPCWIDAVRWMCPPSMPTTSMCIRAIRVPVMGYGVLWAGWVAMAFGACALLRRGGLRLRHVEGAEIPGDVDSERVARWPWALVATCLCIAVYGAAHRHTSERRIDHLIALPLWVSGTSLLSRSVGFGVRRVGLATAAFVALLRIAYVLVRSRA